MEQLKLSDERYESIKKSVIETFQKYNINCTPVNGYEIAIKMGCIIILYSSLNSKKLKAARKLSHDGFSIYNGEKWLIFLNDINIGYKRINNTLLHEIGHIVLDHTEESNLANKEANFFAKYALVPPILIYKKQIKTAEEIEKEFDVSHEAAIYALDYYHKWYKCSGKIKKYEIELAMLFGYKFNITGGDI